VSNTEIACSGSAASNEVCYASICEVLPTVLLVAYLDGLLGVGWGLIAERPPS